MTSDAQDDDRTVIRPLGSSAMAVDDDQRTVIAPAGPGPAAPAVATLPASADMGNGLPVGTRLGEFELTALLGEGGFGIVYLAIDHSLERRVALKEYMPSVLAARSANSQVQVKSERHRETFEAGRKSFVNEARLLASFDHPSLVKVYRFWEANGTAYMVMPFYEGKTLKDLLREMVSPPDEAWLRTLLGPLTEALAVIHHESCYHRDIAPDNVMMLAGTQRPLLLDFGAARRVIGDMTQALTVILKPGYAPVEQYAEIPGMKQGPWTDVYALAAVVYYAIVGKTPPPSVGRLLGDSYVPLVEQAAGRYSAAFLAAIDHALVVRPEARTQDIAQLRSELGLVGGPLAVGGAGAVAGVAASLPVPPGLTPRRPAPGPAAGSTSVASPAAAAPRRNTALATGGVAMALIGLAVGAYLWLSPSPRIATAPDAAAAALTPPATTPTQPTPPATQSPLAAPPAAAATPSTAFDVGGEFDRVVQAQTAGFMLQAQAVKPKMRIGRDDLAFSVQSERDGFLYVLAYGSDGALTLLYPNTESGSLKIRKGQTLKLPQPPIVFETTEPAGAGLLLVMVSARQRDHTALAPRKEGPFRHFPTGADAARIAVLHPALKPLLAGRAICPTASPCDDEFGAAVIQVETVR
jgi:serine/threonine protein kinase